MAVQTAKVLESYSRLKVVLGEEQTTVLVNFLEACNEEQEVNLGKNMVTKSDLYELKEATTNGFNDLKIEMNSMLTTLSNEMRDNKVDQTRWMLGIMITIVGFLTALIFAVFHTH